MNIAIIGAGVLGRLLALTLIEQKHEVTMISNRPLQSSQSAAFASAAMLCPLGEIIHAPTEVVNMGSESLGLWPKILDSLQTLDPVHESTFFQRNGSLAICFPADSSSYAQLRQDLTRKARDQLDNVQTLDRTQLLAKEPALNNFNQGIFLASEGQLCNRTFLRSSSRVIAQNARLVEPTTVDTNMLSNIAKKHDWVIDCRGAGAISDEAIQKPGTGLRGVRGEVIRVHCDNVQLTHPIRVIHPRTSIYIVPKPNHIFVIGATEIESHSEHPITLRSTLELLNTAYAVNSSFAEATVLETNVGIRAAYDDHRPKIKQKNNIVTVNGLYRHGWLVGPALVQRITNQLKEHSYAHCY
jgi:glycine oxidase